MHKFFSATFLFAALAAFGQQVPAPVPAPLPEPSTPAVSTVQATGFELARGFAQTVLGAVEKAGQEAAPLAAQLEKEVTAEAATKAALDSFTAKGRDLAQKLYLLNSAFAIMSEAHAAIAHTETPANREAYTELVFKIWITTVFYNNIQVEWRNVVCKAWRQLYGEDLQKLLPAPAPRRSYPLKQRGSSVASLNRPAYRAVFFWV